MERGQLTVTLREGSGKGVARKIRARAKIPGVIYGKGFENLLIEVDSKEAELLFSDSSKMNALLDLDVAGHGKFPALLKDYQAHVLTRKFTHLDFIKLDLTKKIHLNVPVHFVGKPIGVKDSGGVMDIIRREIEVICLPTSIPDFIEVDVTPLKIGQSVHINDLQLPEGVEIPHGSNFTLVSVVAPHAEEAKTVGSEGPAEPVVLTAKKPAEGEAKKENKK